MANLLKSVLTLSALLCLMLTLSGCTCMGLAVVPAAVSSGAAGVNYTWTNNAYKTISSPFADVESALNKALKKMDIKETNRKTEEGKLRVTAVTVNLDISVALEKGNANHYEHRG